MAYGIPNRRRAPAALALDGKTLDFVRDPTTRRHLQRHPIDAAAFMLLRIQQGSVRSAPEIGETVSKIKYIDAAKLPQMVQDRVLVAWANLIERGAIRLKNVVIDTSVKGAIVYQANYVNLKTGKTGTTPELPFIP